MPDFACSKDDSAMPCFSLIAMTRLRGLRGKQKILSHPDQGKSENNSEKQKKKQPPALIFI